MARYNRRKGRIGPEGYRHPKKKRSFSSGFHLVKCFIRKMSIDKLNVYSAQASYYLLMGVMPMIMLILMLLKFTPLTEDMILDTLRLLFTEQMMEYAEPIISNVYHGSVTIMSIATITMLYLAGNAVRSLAAGLNSIHHIREDRGLLLRFQAIGYTVLLIGMLICCFGLLIAGVQFNQYLSDVFPFLKVSNYLVRILLTALALLLMMLLFTLLYMMLPNCRKSFRSQVPGGIFTTIAWTVYSICFLIWLRVARNLTVVYGSLMTICVAMLWLYFCMYIFFFGAEINAWIENPDSFPF